MTLMAKFAEFVRLSCVRKTRKEKKPPVGVKLTRNLVTYQTAQCFACDVLLDLPCSVCNLCPL